MWIHVSVILASDILLYSIELANATLVEEANVFLIQLLAEACVLRQCLLVVLARI